MEKKVCDLKWRDLGRFHEQVTLSKELLEVKEQLAMKLLVEGRGAACAKALWQDFGVRF